jgi:hypothetical protein
MFGVLQNINSLKGINIMKLLLGSLLLLPAMVFSVSTFAAESGGGNGYDLINYKITSVEARKDSVEVVFDQTDDSLSKHGTLKAQLGKKELEGPIYQVVLAAYTSHSLVDSTLFSRGPGGMVEPNKNAIADIKIKTVAGPDGK